MATPSLLLIPDRYKSGVLYSQLPESGAGDIDFTRASAATRVNASGLIESVASGVPRLDYTGGGCPSLLLEPQRTNLFLNSASGATQSITVTAEAHTLSFYGTGSVTLSDVASGTLEGTGTGVANRVSLTFTPTAGTLTLTVSGTITDVQLEEGSYPTSYIPTTSAAVTRAADAASKTGISSLIGQQEGTIFLEVAVNNANTANGVFFECIGASTADTFVFFIDGSNDDLRLFNSASLVPPEFISDNYTPSTTIKIAFAYKANDYALYVNGVSKTVSATSAVPNGLANIYLNSNRTGGEVSQSTYKQAVVYNTRLSNSQLAQLTAL